MGIVQSLVNESFPPKSTFSVDQIPDLAGQVIIVTGGSTGIGKETAKALLQHNAKVYIAARSQERSEAAIKSLAAETGKTAHFLKLDLADLKSIKVTAEEFLSKETQLHVLFNNGGVMVPPIDQLTADGYDLQFGTNVLGHFYFTKLLLPILESTAKATSTPTRVVNTSSFAQTVGKLDFGTFRDSPKRVKMGKQGLYSQSKLGNVIFAQELTRRYGDRGIVATSVNPGNIKTDLQRHVKIPGLLQYIFESLLWPGPYGALTQLYAGTSPEGANLNGAYLIPWARVSKAQKAAYDPELGKELWTWLEEQVKDI